MKTLAALASAALISAAGLLCFFSNPVVIAVKLAPLKPSAELPSFHAIEDDPSQAFDANSDTVHDALRDAVLAAAENLKRDLCNPTLKTRYIEAASKYARAWLTIAPCVGKGACGPSDSVPAMVLVIAAAGEVQGRSEASDSMLRPMAN